MEKWGVSREEMDDIAMRSYQRAWKSIEEGRFKKEIVPVSVPGKKGETKIFETDEIPLKPPKTSAEALRGLKPAFKKDGKVTAGNASKISDGAAALVVMAKERAKALG